jgi:hypothetical protein
MAKSKGNDASNQKFGPLPHHKASDAINKGLDRLKRDPHHVENLLRNPKSS